MDGTHHGTGRHRHDIRRGDPLGHGTGVPHGDGDLHGHGVPPGHGGGVLRGDGDPPGHGDGPEADGEARALTTTTRVIPVLCGATPQPATDPLPAHTGTATQITVPHRVLATTTVRRHARATTINPPRVRRTTIITTTTTITPDPDAITPALPTAEAEEAHSTEEASTTAEAVRVEVRHADVTEPQH